MEGNVQPMPVVPGDVLASKYRVERVLGKGAMGLVVAARHLDLGELFAIKLLLPQAALHPQAIDRFLREARAAARLKGEHIAKVTDVGKLTDGSPYMVMEHLEGTDLQQHVRAHGPLAIDDAISHVLQACDAIAEAHALGIVHRDLKLSNLFLIRRPNGTSCVKVLDFGISKQATPDAVDLTKTGEVFGTPLYMAPEQMARTKDADGRCDVWSMGVVLHELLIGTPPFLATTLTEVVARVLQEEATPPSLLRPDVPAAIDAVVARCLQKRPENRFQRIEDLAATLRSLSAPGPFAQPRAGSPPQIPVPISGASYTRSEVATLPIPSPALPSPRASASSLPSAPAANTASAWGTTGGLRSPNSSGRGFLIALAIAGLLMLSAVIGGVWFALRSSKGSAAAEPTETTVSGRMPVASAPAVTAVPPEPSVPSVAPATSSSHVSPPPLATAVPALKLSPTAKPSRPIAPGNAPLPQPSPSQSTKQHDPFL